MWGKKAKPVKRGLKTVRVLAFLTLMTSFFGFMPQMVIADGDQYTFDLSLGAVAISPEAYGKLDVLYDGGANSLVIDETDLIIITGTTVSLGYIEADGPANYNIKLKDVKVDVSSGTGASDCAFAVTRGAIVNLTLEGDNELISAEGEAGLNVDDRSSELIIGSAGGTGSQGTLVAVGSTGTGGGGAGIGGSLGEKAGEITVTGGRITARGGLGAAGIGGGTNGDFTNIVISGSAVIEQAAGGDADGVNGAGGAGIGSGGTDTLSPVSTGTISISAGVDLARISQGGGEPGGMTAGAQIGTGGSADTVSFSYPSLHTLTFHANDEQDTVQKLTYTAHNGAGDAILPVLGHIQEYNASFASPFFDGFWYETPLAQGIHAVGTRFPSVAFFDLYAREWEEEPKTGL